MIRAALGRLREWWAIEDSEDRFQGTGEVYLDPAYNGRYTAERRLEMLAKAQDEAEEER